MHLLNIHFLYSFRKSPAKEKRKRNSSWRSLFEFLTAIRWSISWIIMTGEGNEILQQLTRPKQLFLMFVYTLIYWFDLIWLFQFEGTVPSEIHFWNPNQSDGSIKLSRCLARTTYWRNAKPSSEIIPIWNRFGTCQATPTFNRSFAKWGICSTHWIKWTVVSNIFSTPREKKIELIAINPIRYWWRIDWRTRRDATHVFTSDLMAEWLLKDDC